MNREDQELLTRTSAGTPMGDLLRRYWLPVQLSAQLQPGGPICRLRRLGEDLVIARAPDGTLVALAASCPHRGASLHLGHNEAGGLRCVYHGWKFDPRGQCVEMPNEPEQNRFCDRVKTRAYACRERGGVVWLHVGAADEASPLPDLEWNLDARCPAHLHASVRECNWLQAMGGDLDSSHIGVLHARFDDPSAPTVPGAAMPGSWAIGMQMVRGRGAPYLEVVDTAYGALYTARRPLEDGSDYHRVHPFLFPCHTMLGGGGEPGQLSFNGKYWVPIDDTHTWMLDWHYRPETPWTEAECAAIERARYPFAAGAVPGPEDDYGRDRRLEGTRMFWGVVSNPLQDRAVEESMGAIANRDDEHLGPADAMIIRVRKRLLAAARALRDDGAPPPGAETPRLYRVRPVGVVLPRGTGSGYSTLWLTLGLGERRPRPRLVTIEPDTDKASLARETFARCGVTELVEQRVADAAAELQTLGPLAFVFMDHGPSNYEACRESLISGLVPGGLLAVDNIDSHRRLAASFVRRVEADPRVECCVVHVGKGVLVARRR